MTLVNAFENDVLDAMLGATATLIGTPVTFGLSTADPGEDGSGMIEPVGLGYARVSVVNNGTNWGPAASGQKINATDIIFPAAVGGSWGLISHWALYLSGVMKLNGLIDDGLGGASPRQVDDTDVFRFLAGELRITLD